MPNAASNVIPFWGATPKWGGGVSPLPCDRPRVYIQITEDDQVSYGVEGIGRAEAIRLHKATLRLAEWLMEIVDG